MSLVYLFRHGQAGSRDDYDRLSDLGLEQATLLGQHLAQDGIELKALYMGGLRRQQETAATIVTELRKHGVAVPDPIEQPAFSEFDLTAVYRAMAPQLAAASETFRQQYEELERESAIAQSAVHRRWTQCDIDVVRAWIEGRYPCAGTETWAEFTARVRSGLEHIAAAGTGPQDAIAISTSATPIGIWMGLALRLDPLYVMRAAAALYNASFSVFRWRQGELHLSSFNNIPHLKRPELRTYR
ncbi:MAG: histidine phosphatase family protein [Bryobacterales bacterium]|nr:histidine phosphatase family protein [Bryobacterales bacterium]